MTTVTTGTTARHDQQAADDVAAAERLLNELHGAHAEGRKLADELASELSACDDHLDEVMAIVAATVRHSREPVVIVDGELGIRLASPSATELLGEQSSLRSLLPAGGAAAARRCLVPAASDDRPTPDDPDDEAQPTVVRLRSGRLEYRVERVCALVRPLGGLWGGWLPATRGGAGRPPAPRAGGPRYPYGLVTLRPLAGEPAGDDTPTP